MSIINENNKVTNKLSHNTYINKKKGNRINKILTILCSIIVFFNLIALLIIVLFYLTINFSNPNNSANNDSNYQSMIVTVPFDFGYVANNKFQKDNLSISEIVKKVNPSVVTLINHINVKKGLSNKTIKKDKSFGSGFIFDKSGLILTNYHVIDGNNSMTVILSNGMEVEAKVVNYDKLRDLAVLKISLNIKNLPLAELGDINDLQTGDLVVAIGSPMGKDFSGTATSGIISTRNRIIIENNLKYNFIQTDTPINPGNSGGPLINSKGMVIGINTMKISKLGIEGMGFAIPIDEVKSKLPSLLLN